MTDGELFEAMYLGAGRDRERLGWTKPGPAPILTRWLEQEPRSPGRAMVVACGVGDDGEYLASLGWEVSAFDISPTAIDWARERTPKTTVDYRAADLFALPEEWQRAFDLVVEVWTIQSIPPDRAAEAITSIAGLVGDRGTLLVSTLTSLDGGDVKGPPWPVEPAVLEAFLDAGLVVIQQDDDATPFPGVGSLQIEYRLPAQSFSGTPG